jgi:hypothetical protein
MQRLTLLLLLLGIDWYFDTSFGTSPFTRPMYSTEVVCNSLSYKHDLQTKLDLPDSLDVASSACLIDPMPSPIPGAAKAPLPALPSAAHTYIFMTMQC